MIEIANAAIAALGATLAPAVVSGVVRLDRHRMMREAMRDQSGGKADRLTRLLHGPPDQCTAALSRPQTGHRPIPGNPPDHRTHGRPDDRTAGQPECRTVGVPVRGGQRRRSRRSRCDRCRVSWWRRSSAFSAAAKCSVSSSPLRWRSSSARSPATRCPAAAASTTRSASAGSGSVRARACSQARCRHVEEHQRGTRPRAPTRTVAPHQPQLTAPPRRRTTQRQTLSPPARTGELRSEVQLPNSCGLASTLI